LIVNILAKDLFLSQSSEKNGLALHGGLGGVDDAHVQGLAARSGQNGGAATQQAAGLVGTLAAGVVAQVSAGVLCDTVDTVCLQVGLQNAVVRQVIGMSVALGAWLDCGS